MMILSFSFIVSEEGSFFLRFSLSTQSSPSTVWTASLADDSHTISSCWVWSCNALYLLLLESLAGEALAFECLLDSLPDDSLLFLEE